VDPITARLIELLPAYGPWLLFVLAVLETSFVTGLVVPSGVATSVGTVLALEGALALPEVVLAALAGGWVGDSLGFWIGRVGGRRVLAGEARVSRMINARQAKLSRFLGRHPLYSVTVARLVSFVRTIMPMAAGMSRLPYSRFLGYEALGLVGWVALYVGIGVVSRGSWRLATQLVGVGGALAFIAAGAALWWVLRRRPSGPRADVRAEGPSC
jgi:membrane protein DedA with SNARE-associated domain